MKIHSLFILDVGGSCFYSRNFTNEFNLNVNLITPFFSAIITFAENVISRKMEILEMGDLRFVFKKRNKFIFAILADAIVSILFIHSRLDRVMNVFFDLYYKPEYLDSCRVIEDSELDNMIEEIIRGEEEILKNNEFYQKVIDLFKEQISKNEIIGACLLTTKGNIIYSSLPNQILLDSLRELEIRFMTGVESLPELFYQLENGQKVFSKIIHVDKEDIDFLIVLLFETSVPLGMAELNLIKVGKLIKNIV
ncbi:MAG: hypothetical protein ACTSUN_08095 [Promethearchaeota archaeon]